MIRLVIQYPPPGDNILANMAKLSSEIPKAIKRGLDYGLQFVVGRIKADRLSGIGPYPPDQHRLGQRTGLLSDSLNATPAVISGTSVIATIDNPVIYAGVHEFGATIVAKTSKGLRFQIDGKWIIAKQVTIPERMPVRYGFSEPSNTAVIQEAIMYEVEQTVNAV